MKYRRRTLPDIRNMIRTCQKHVLDDLNPILRNINFCFWFLDRMGDRLIPPGRGVDRRGYEPGVEKEQKKTKTKVPKITSTFFPKTSLSIKVTHPKRLLTHLRHVQRLPRHFSNTISYIFNHFRPFFGIFFKIYHFQYKIVLFEYKIYDRIVQR